MNKNYSVIFKLYHNENHKFTQIDDKNTFLRADFEFPFGIDLNKGAEERDNAIDADIKINDRQLNVNFNNEDYFCVLKSFYDNQDYIPEDDDE